MSIIKYQSSPVDWCENNYSISYFICEFNNTFSSFLFIIFGIYQIMYYSKLLNNINYWLFFKLLFFTNIIIGIGSILFHSTLSIFGQVVDELSIIAFICIMNLIFNDDLMLPCFLIISLFFPFYSRFIMLSVGSYCIFNLIKQYKNFDKNLIDHLFYNFIIFSISLVFWFLDIFYCDKLFFATHFIWHIFSSIALHNMTVLAIYHKNKDLKIKNKIIFDLKKNKNKYNFDNIL